ncbi:hypothetical protein D9611_008138 [Ephemerocybe angulata]|uniref:NLE domain-containing protein n=1 Tax=Ephemerocybe angulata TaxID=980116 RepID=A0A8H5FD40_9AGAR|nr:hypothetical protein D9611_008138 [Tulosesus angulatus]
MATRLPPPKRQKTYHGVPEPAPEAPKPSPNIVVQFVSEEDGSSLCPAVNIPANLTRENLESLLNKLSTKDEDPVPFSFHVNLPESKTAPAGANTRIVIASSIEKDVLEHPSEDFTPEDVIVIHCAPQSVFRVRPATRCSSTLTAFSPTGNLLATGSGDMNVRLWDLNTELPSHTLSGHAGWVLCVEWEAMERKLASGGHDGRVRLWDPATGQPLGDALRGHTKWIMSLAWEPIHINATSPRLASASKDGTVRVWDTALRRLEYTLGGHSASVNIVKWGGSGGSKGALYTASSDRTVRVWDAEQGRPIMTLKDHAHWVTTLTLNTDFILRTGPFDHKGKKPASEEEAQALAKARFDNFLKSTPELLISGSDDHTLFLWSLFPSASPASVEADKRSSVSKPLTRLTGHQKQISHVVFSPDGRWAASAAWDSSVRIWEGRTGKFVATLRGHVGPVYRVAWSADSRLLISASKDSTLKIWDLKTYKIKTDLPGHTDEVYCVDFVADKVVSGGRDKTVKIWKN